MLRKIGKLKWLTLIIQEDLLTIRTESNALINFISLNCKKLNYLELSIDDSAGIVLLNRILIELNWNKIN